MGPCEGSIQELADRGRHSIEWQAAEFSNQANDVGALSLSERADVWIV